MRFHLQKVLLLVCFSLVLLTCTQKHSGQQVKRTFLRIDTIISVTLAVSDTLGIGQTWSQVDSLLQTWEQRFSLHTPSSELPALNQRTQNSVVVSAELGTMIATGLAFGDSLNGSFDITVAPLKHLWGLASDDTIHHVPAPALLQKALASIDYRNVLYHPRTRTVTFKDPHTSLDIGGIAKGFVLQNIYTLLKQHAYTGILIAAGGDIIATGTRTDGSPWYIGIRHPRQPGALLASFPLTQGAVVTSGDYERYWIHNGRRYHHLFNPRTGYPAIQNQSVTIYAPSPIEADILSTGLFGLSADSIISYIDKRPHLACLVVAATGTTYISSGWRTTIQLTP